uniref:Elongin-A n=1 Tax=Romanomermis culicivorax TaxID=13658 RepID=A0A915IGK9_ROMCU
MSSRVAEYKPQPYVRDECTYNGSSSKRKAAGFVGIELDQSLFSAKKDRCKVFTGRRNPVLKEVPTLYDSCIRILCDNIDGLGYTGGVPYDILKPILERASAEQLCRIEDLNPYLVEDTDQLWEALCKRDFKRAQREELESWKEVYERLFDERELKLEKIKSHINASNKKAEITSRQTILAVVKAPRDVKRKQDKFGTSRSLVAINGLTPSESKRHITDNAYRPSTSSATVSEVVITPKNVRPGNNSTLDKKRKPVAPLMAKTLKMLKKSRR